MCGSSLCCPGNLKGHLPTACRGEKGSLREIATNRNIPEDSDLSKYGMEISVPAPGCQSVIREWPSHPSYSRSTALSTNSNPMAFMMPTRHALQDVRRQSHQERPLAWGPTMRHLSQTWYLDSPLTSSVTLSLTLKSGCWDQIYVLV